MEDQQIRDQVVELDDLQLLCSGLIYTDTPIGGSFPMEETWMGVNQRLIFSKNQRVFSSEKFQELLIA